jgi:hypothetical protein
LCSGIVWLGLFGPTLERGHGIVWGPLDETGVGYCNIRLQLKEDLTARVDVLTRPVAQQMFWKELEDRSPDWEVYTRFLDRNLPVLLGTERYTLLDRGAAPAASIYAGPVFGELTGARRMTVSADLTTVLQPAAAGGYLLELTDFWRSEGRECNPVQGHEFLCQRSPLRPPAHAAQARLHQHRAALAGVGDRGQRLDLRAGGRVPPPRKPVRRS